MPRSNRPPADSSPEPARGTQGAPTSPAGPERRPMTARRGAMPSWLIGQKDRGYWLPRPLGWGLRNGGNQAGSQPRSMLAITLPLGNGRVLAAMLAARSTSRFLSIDILSCWSFRPSSALRQQLRSSTMLLLARLEDERKSYAIWYINFRQSPKYTP